MPRLSIVIPCVGGAAEFDGALVSVLQNRPRDCEVLVAHTQPYDDPYDLGGEVRFLYAPRQGRVQLLNTALNAARGEVLHIVQCGLEVSEGWAEPALAHFDDAEVAAVSPAVVRPGDGRLVSAGVRWSLGGVRREVTDQRLLSPGAGRLRSRVLGPSLAAAFYRREALVALQGFDAAADESLADVDVALALRDLGLLNICEPNSRLVQADAAAGGDEARGFSFGRTAERLYWRTSSAGGGLLSLLAHPLAIAGETIRQLPRWSAASQLCGRLLGFLEVGAARARHERRLAAAVELLEESESHAPTVKLPSSGASSAAPPSHRRAA